VADKKYRYQHKEGSFTQPNASICQDMLNWTVEHSSSFGGNLLELYCGNGNFTLPLAQNFERVLATEVSKISIRSAKYNCKINSINNIDFVRMSSEEITEALNNVRPFRRLSHLDLENFPISTIFVDPPRAGLDDDTNKLLQRFDNIIYISCNPETLKQNLISISSTHQVVKMALFDQFPYTNHREVGAILKKKPLTP
jgi:tRNA (uracil-5-)-methyltransferase